MMATENAGRDTSVSRRNFLTTAGITGVAALAGCVRSTRNRPEDGGGGGDGGNGGSGGDGENLSGSITITGSSTVYPVSLLMAEEFQKQHQQVNISVDSTGTGGGFKNHFCTGNSDVNGASRPIQASEKEQCKGNGVTPVEFQIASDALTVAVNNEADWVDCMTFEELAQIWKPNGAQKWSDVRDDWPDKQIELFGPASTSGTFDWFTEHVIGEAGAHREDYEATEEDNIIIQGIEGSKYAMGYFGFSYYLENQDRVKAVKIKKKDGGECVAPSIESAKSGDYPLARPLFIYPAKEALMNRTVEAFVRFYIKKAETDLVANVGYVPISPDLRDKNLDKLNSIVNEGQ